VFSTDIASDNGRVISKIVTWLTRALLAIGVLVVLVYVADSPRRQRRDDDVRRRLNAKAHALKVDLDRNFPVGAPQSDVVDFLRKQPTHWRSEPENRYWLSVGTGPSDVWYCGSVDIGIWAKFERGRLISTEVGTWSLDCL
jgi:hypothetical protein